MAAGVLPRALRVGGVPEHFNLPWQLGIETGAFAAADLPVEWTDYAAGTGAMLADLEAGQLDVAVLLTEGAALGLAQGHALEAITLYTTTPLIWGVHVPPEAAAASITELAGRRFAISRLGSGSHLMSLALGLEHGWALAELEFEVVGDLPGAIAAFAEGRAEVFLWEHFTTEPMVEAGKLSRVDDFLAPWPAWTICVRTALRRSQGDRIERLCQTVAEEARSLVARPDCVPLIASRYGLQPSAVERWLARTRWVEAITSPTAALAAAEAMLRAAGVLRG